MGLCTWMCSVVCAVCFEVDFCARALCVRAHAVVRAQGRALCADSGLPGLRAGGALSTWADVLVLVCVFGVCTRTNNKLDRYYLEAPAGGARVVGCQ